MPQGLVSLHDALLSGEVEQVTAAMQQPHDINERNEDTFTVLMVAAAMGRQDIVSALLQAGADPTLTEGQGLNAVHLTTLGRQPDGQYTEVLQMLLQRSTAQNDLANVATAFSDSPLHFCASMSAEPELSQQALTMAQVLLQHGADPNALNAAEHSAIQIARDGCVDDMAQVLQSAADARRDSQHQSLTSTGTAQQHAGSNQQPQARSPVANSPLQEARTPSQLEEPPQVQHQSYTSAPELDDSSLTSHMPSPTAFKDGAVPGALMEGTLHLLNKKKKDWEEVYYAIVPLLKDSQGSGHGDFSYMLHSFTSKAMAKAVSSFVRFTRKIRNDLCAVLPSCVAVRDFAT